MYGASGFSRTIVPGFSRTILVLCLAVSIGACTKTRPATPPRAAPLAPLDQLARDLTDLTRRPGVERGVWGIVVQSLERPERLFEQNPRTLLVPASAAKLVSVASAVDAVGWDYQYQTTVSTNGHLLDAASSPPETGTLKGDLVVSGSGDPSIGGRGGDDFASWIEAIKAAGIRRIDGRIVGDDDAVEEPRAPLAWAWDDLGYPTGALFGALNVAENRLAVTVTPGPAAGMPAVLSVEPFAVDRPLVNRALTSTATSVQLLWPEQRPGEPGLTIAGSIPAGALPARLIVSAGNPTLWFVRVLRYRLIAAGIAVTGAAVDIDDLNEPLDRASLVTIHVHRSRKLSEIVRPLLKESINLYGEAVLRLNVPPPAYPTNDAALEALHRRLASWGVPPGGEQMVDGSGLSRRDAISVDALATVLQRMFDRENASPWMTSLPVAGVDGSLDTRMRGTAAEGNVRAKTGTMSNVRALAGYVTTRDGERLAFAALVNNFEGTGAQATQAIDAIAVRLAGFTRKK